MFSSEFRSGWGIGCSTSRATEHVLPSRWCSRGGERLPTSNLGRMLSRALIPRLQPLQTRSAEEVGDVRLVWEGGCLLRGAAGAPGFLRACFPNEKWEVRAGRGLAYVSRSNVGGPESCGGDHAGLAGRRRLYAGVNGFSPLPPTQRARQKSNFSRFINSIETQIFSCLSPWKKKDKKTPQQIKHPHC